jgi:hypothetical protein
MSTATRRRITVFCVTVSALLLLAVLCYAAAVRSAAPIGLCGWPVASITAGAGYLRRTGGRRR